MTARLQETHRETHREPHREPHPPPDAGLTDPHGRRIESLRLAVTDRCNLRCFLAGPRLPGGFRGHDPAASPLTPEEIGRLAGAFTGLGVSKVRLAGGEPLLRRDLIEVAARLSALPGLTDLSLSTNATQLARQAEGLRGAGVRRLNVSLDTLIPERFAQLSGGRLKDVLTGLDAARKAGLAPIRINMVAMKGVNDDEFIPMAEFCGEHGFALRFIEAMPVGAASGRASRHTLDLRVVRAILARRFDLMPGVLPGGGPARFVQVRGTGLHIGFITPRSRHFCAACHRVSVSAEGALTLCLGQDHRVALRPLLREGASREALQGAIREAVARKPLTHDLNEQQGARRGGCP